MLIWLLIQPLWAIQSQACRELFDPSLRLSNNRLALLESAKKGKLNELKTFLETVDSNQLEQNNPLLEEVLMIAITANHVDTVKYLLSLIQDQSTLKATLTLATQEGQIDIVKSIFQNLDLSLPLFQEAEVPFIFESHLVKKLLTEAFVSHKLDIFQFYFSEKGFKIDNIDPALIRDFFKTAVRENREDFVKFYLSKKGFGFTKEGMLEAIFYHKSDILKLFFEQIPQASQHLPDTILLDMIFSEKSMEDLIISSGDRVQEILKILIENGMNVKKINANGDTLLHILLRHKHYHVVSNIFTINQEYQTSLELQSAYLSVLKILHELGIETYKPMKDKKGNTLAHSAALGGNSKVIQELYHLGHKLTIQNNKGETVWDLMKQHRDLFRNESYSIYQQIAREFLLNQIKSRDQLEDQILIDILTEGVLTSEEFTELLPEMIKKGVDPNAKTAHGDFVLHLAIDILVYTSEPSTRYINHTQKKLIFVKTLIDNGADVKAKNKEGDSILHVELKRVIKKQYSKAFVNLFMKKIEFLIYEGELDPNITNKAGKTIIDILSEKLDSIKDKYKKRQIRKMIREIERQKKRLEIKINYREGIYWWTKDKA